MSRDWENDSSSNGSKSTIGVEHGCYSTRITKFAQEKHFRSADVYDFLSSKLNLPEHFRVYHIF